MEKYEDQYLSGKYARQFGEYHKGPEGIREIRERGTDQVNEIGDDWTI